MSVLSHVATFAGGFVAGYISYGLTVGDDPNAIWETAKKSCSNVSEAAGNGVGQINVHVIQPIRNKIHPVEDEFKEVVPSEPEIETEAPSEAPVQ